LFPIIFKGKNDNVTGKCKRATKEKQEVNQDNSVYFHVILLIKLWNSLLNSLVKDDEKY